MTGQKLLVVESFSDNYKVGRHNPKGNSIYIRSVATTNRILGDDQKLLVAELFSNIYKVGRHNPKGNRTYNRSIATTEF